MVVWGVHEEESTLLQRDNVTLVQHYSPTQLQHYKQEIEIEIERRMTMYYDPRDDIRDVRENFGEFVKADDEALRILNRVRFEKKTQGGFMDRMMAVREVLREEGYDVPFRVGGYRRAK